MMNDFYPLDDSWINEALVLGSGSGVFGRG